MRMKCKVGASGEERVKIKQEKRASSFVAGPEEAGGSSTLCSSFLQTTSFHLPSRVAVQLPEIPSTRSSSPSV